MRMQSGVVDQYIYFVAVDATDYVTRETGLSAFTVVRSRNGGADATYTTPTITEIDNTTMPGVYALLLDEDMTIDSGDDSQEICLHITCSGMAPVTRTIELYRPVVTAGRTLDVSAGGEAGIDWSNVGSPTTTQNLSGTTVKTATDVETDTADIQSRIPAALGANGNIKADIRDYNGTAGTFSGGRPEVNTTHAAGTAWGSGAITAGSIAADAITAAKLAADVTTEIQNGLATAAALSTAQGNITDILADTNELQTDWANGGRLDLILDGRASQTSVDDLPTNAELATALEAADDATLAAIAALSIPTANQNADALLDRAAGVETGLTVRQWARLTGSVLLGKVSGAGTGTEVFRDFGDTKDRITATVDASGNRTAITRDAT